MPSPHRKYYLMIVQYEKGDQWCVEFGDYDRETVSDQLENEWENFFKSKIRSVSNDRQETIDEFIKQLNK